MRGHPSQEELRLALAALVLRVESELVPLSSLLRGVKGLPADREEVLLPADSWDELVRLARLVRK